MGPVLIKEGAYLHAASLRGDQKGIEAGFIDLVDLDPTFDQDEDTIEMTPGACHMQWKDGRRLGENLTILL